MGEKLPPLARKRLVAKKGKHFPTPQEILEFMKSSPRKVGKREIARAFGLKGQDRLKLKTVLRDMGEEGVIKRGHKKALRSHKQLPPVALVEVSSELTQEGEVLLTSVDIKEDLPPILLTEPGAARVKPGDRLLVRVSVIRMAIIQPAF